MPLSPVTKETLDPLAVCRHKFEGVFDMHGIKIGSPEDLADFVEKLKTNRYFAMDFWEIARSAGRRGDYVISCSEIREMVVQCVAGSGVPDSDPNVQEIQREFDGKFANDVERVESQQGAETAQAAVEVEAGNATDSSNISSGADVPSQFAPDPEEPVYTIGSEGAEEEPSGAFPYSRSRQMDDALARLEINSNALKLHLENIDSRMSRIEPHIGDSSSTASTPVSRGSTGNGIREAEVDNFPPGTAPAPEPTVVGGAASKKRAAPERPVWADGRSIMLAIAPVLLVVLLVVLMAWLWGLQYRSRHQAAYRVGANTPNGAPDLAAGGNLAASVVSPRTQPPNQVATINTTSSNMLAKPDVSSAKTDIPPSENASSKPEPPIGSTSRTKKRIRHVNSKRPTPAEEASDDLPGIVTVTSASGAESEGSSANDDEDSSRHLKRRTESGASDDEGLSHGISVSFGVMATHLIESHPPTYPRLAKLTHIQGPVVLQVFISKDGTVNHIDVVKGHRLLRGAAKKAVRQWRYRPYLLNGHPVQVATIVTVNFQLGKQESESHSEDK